MSVTEYTKWQQKQERIQRLTEGRQQRLEQDHQQRLAAPAEGVKPQLVLVRVGDIRFDGAYQTIIGEEPGGRYDAKRARTIAEHWDWNALDPITINVRPEEPEVMYCPDGRHRTEAALMRFGPDEYLFALQHHVSREREVQMFYDQDKMRKRVSSAQKFTSKLAIGDPVTVAQQGILDRLNLAVGLRALNRTMALTPFLECCKKSLPATEAALRILTKRFDGAEESLVSTRIKGVTWFIANRQDHPNFHIERVEHVFGSLTIADFIPLDRKAYGIAGHQRIAEMIAEHYNYKLTDKHRIPRWNEKGEA